MTIRNKSRFLNFLPLLAGLCLAPQAALASYAYYVGENLTADGSVLLAGTGEEVSSHWLEIVPRQTHAPDETITVGVTAEASIPGERTEIPQVETTYKYISMNYSDFEGFPAPLTNGGLNEYQVAIRDVWSPSRPELIDMTPTPQHGPQYSDLARIALQRAKTAREAVEIIGSLIDKHGYSTYGGNTHIIADPDEGWIIKEMAGGQGLWVAERLGPNDIRVAYPGYIGNIPKDYKDNSNYMGSDNLISFAVEQGWYDPESGEPFNIHEVYGASEENYARGPQLMAPKEIEAELRALAPVSMQEMMELVRDPRITDDHAGYGQVAHLRDDLAHRELAVLWVAPTGSVTAPFIPWYMGVQKVAPEFRQHRYLTKNSGSSYLDDEFMLQEATRFAGRVFKQLMYYTCAHPRRFLPEVTATLTAFEANLLAEQDDVRELARTLYASDKAELVRQYLTRYSNSQALRGLRLGESLLASISARTHVFYDIPKPAANETINWYYDGVGDDSSCLALPIDPDSVGDVPESDWLTNVPGVDPQQES